MPIWAAAKIYAEKKYTRTVFYAKYKKFVLTN